jgi:hypothetical protein
MKPKTMIDPIDFKLYMDGDRLMLWWRGHQTPDAASGGEGGIIRRNCGGTVDLTAHLQQIVRSILSVHPPGGVGGGKP